jgi:hypothetical protein
MKRTHCADAFFPMQRLTPWRMPAFLVGCHILSGEESGDFDFGNCGLKELALAQVGVAPPR